MTFFGYWIFMIANSQSWEILRSEFSGIIEKYFRGYRFIAEQSIYNSRRISANFHWNRINSGSCHSNESFRSSHDFPPRFCFRATKSGYRIHWSCGLLFHMAWIATAIIVTLRSGFYFGERGIPDFYFGAVWGASRFIRGSWNFYFTPILYACNTLSTRLLSIW